MDRMRNISEDVQKNSLVWVRKHSDAFYKAAFYFFIAGLLFFAFSRPILGDDSPIVDSGVGYQSRQNLGRNQVQIVQRGYNSDRHYIQVFFDVTVKDNVGKALFDAKVIDTVRQKLVPATLEKITDRYYVLKVENVPNNWRHFMINYGFVTKSQPLINRKFDTDDASKVLSSQDTQQGKVVQKSYMMDYRKLNDSHKVEVLSKAEYVTEYVKLEIKENDKAISKIQDDITQARQDIVQYESHLSDLKAQKKKAVGSQVDDLQANIDDINNSIQGSKDTINNGQSAVKDYQKMNQKLREQL